MNVITFVCWQEDGLWLGYLQDYPDFWTQGETEADLREHLADLHADLSNGLVPGAQRVNSLSETPT